MAATSTGIRNRVDTMLNTNAFFNLGRCVDIFCLHPPYCLVPPLRLPACGFRNQGILLCILLSIIREASVFFLLFFTLFLSLW